MATDERRTPDEAPASRSQSSEQPWSGKRSGTSVWNDPLSLWGGAAPFQRVAHEMERWVREMMPNRSSGGSSSAGPHAGEWTPDVESLQRGHEFIIRIDLPGMKKEDVAVQVQDDSITVQGERHGEPSSPEGRYFRAERRYGRFTRTVPLPEGAIPETAAATLTDGVLEITLQAPPREVTGGRRIEIHER